MLRDGMFGFHCEVEYLLDAEHGVVLGLRRQLLAATKWKVATE